MASKYYAIAKGRRVGIFTNWSECKSYVNGYPSAKYKSFISIKEAQDYLLPNGFSLDNGSLNKEIIPDNREDNITSNKKIIQENLENNISPNTNDEIVYIYTDGSHSEENGGIGLVYVYKDQIISKVSEKVREYPTTNNRSELFAIYVALFNIKDFTKHYIIYSDSEYSVKTYTYYIFNYIKNGFKTSNGSPVKNRDIIEISWELIKFIKSQTILEIGWIKAHDDNIYNNLADELANEGRKK